MLYYDDPLIAAYMCREFGVKFEYDIDVSRLLHNAQVSQIGTPVPRSHIHPDSLDIFKPKDGDLFVTEEPTKRNFTQGIPDIIRFDKSYHTVKYDDEDNMGVVTGGGTWLDVLRIIERDGKQFFTPKEEI